METGENVRLSLVAIVTVMVSEKGALPTIFCTRALPDLFSTRPFTVTMMSERLLF
jgi:hypothetical protein